MKVWWIGTEGGFLPAPVNITDDHDNRILLALAERADIIVDFANVPPRDYVLRNLGPDEPFGGGTPFYGCDPENSVGPDDCFEPANLDTTGQVMEFRVLDVTAAVDPGADPTTLQLPMIEPLGIATNTQYVSLNEDMFMHENFPEEEGPVAALLGTYNPITLEPTPLLWMDPVTENPAVGAVEEWKLLNLTADAHPIHIHQVQFQVVSRIPVGGGTSVAGQNTPLPWETGFKDTVIAYPDEITTVKSRFDLPGLYVWHCHIVEHEDNEMMRPYHIGPIDPDLPNVQPMP